MFQEICELLTAHCPNSPVARAMRTRRRDLPKLLPLGSTSPSAGNGSTSPEPSGIVEGPSRFLILFIRLHLGRISDTTFSPTSPPD